MILIGRLARDVHFKREGIGKLPCWDALHRCYDISFQVGSMAVVVDPIDKNAVNFYQNYDFQLLPDSGLLSQRFEEGIQSIHEGISKKGGTKKLTKVYERIGRPRMAIFLLHLWKGNTS